MLILLSMEQIPHQRDSLTKGPVHRGEKYFYSIAVFCSPQRFLLFSAKSFTILFKALYCSVQSSLLYSAKLSTLLCPTSTKERYAFQHRQLIVTFKFTSQRQPDKTDRTKGRDSLLLFGLDDCLTCPVLFSQVHPPSTTPLKHLNGALKITPHSFQEL